MSCFFGHKWPKWERKRGVMELSLFLFNESDKYACEYLERVCQRCGKVEVEEIKPK